MLDFANGELEISEFRWVGTAERAEVKRAGAVVAEIVRKVGHYRVRVFPRPDYTDHWIRLHFHTEVEAIAGIVGALAVIEDKNEEGLV